MADEQTPVPNTPPPTFDLPKKTEAPAEATPPPAAEVKPDNANPSTGGEQNPKPADPNQAPEQTTPPEQKEGEQTDDSKKSETEEKPKAPEKYDLKLSEKSLLKQEHLDKIAAEAKARDLSQEDAAALLKAREGEVQTAFEQAVKDRGNQWLEQAKADKEFGGDKLDSSIKLAKDTLQKYGDDGFRKELTESGFGNHPGLIRLLARIGKASANDTAVITHAAPKPVRSAAEIMYDKTPKQT